MNPAKRIVLPLLSAATCMLLASCASTMLVTESEGWKQLAAAADAQSARPGKVSLQLGWEVPKKRVLMLARQGDEQMVLYYIDPKAESAPTGKASGVRCHFQDRGLYCAAPGEASASLVAGSVADLWTALQTHAARQIEQVNGAGQAALQAQLTKPRPGPRFDLARQRHPFEWGGEHETVENAQAFLEAVTAPGTPFRSAWPRTPWLGSQGNEWQNEGEVVSLTTTKRCVSLATSPARTALHYNHDFWAADTVTFKTVYRWQQPIDWSKVRDVKLDKDGVFMHGGYTGSFQGQGLAYVSGWSPDILTANATRFDPAKYSVADWNVTLMLPNAAGLRERVVYAVTYLNIMCGKG